MPTEYAVPLPIVAEIVEMLVIVAVVTVYVSSFHAAIVVLSSTRSSICSSANVAAPTRHSLAERFFATPLFFKRIGFSLGGVTRRAPATGPHARHEVRSGPFALGPAFG